MRQPPGAIRAKSVSPLTQLFGDSDNNDCYSQPGLDRSIKSGNFRSEGRVVLQKTIIPTDEKAILLRRGSQTWPEGSGRTTVEASVKRYYQNLKPETGACGSTDRFTSDSTGAGRGVPSEGARATTAQAEQGPFDPLRYWDFFPGTD